MYSYNFKAINSSFEFAMALSCLRNSAFLQGSRIRQAVALSRGALVSSSRLLSGSIDAPSKSVDCKTIKHLLDHDNHELRDNIREFLLDDVMTPRIDFI